MAECFSYCLSLLILHDGFMFVFKCLESGIFSVPAHIKITDTLELTALRGLHTFAELYVLH